MFRIVEVSQLSGVGDGFAVNKADVVVTELAPPTTSTGDYGIFFDRSKVDDATIRKVQNAFNESLEGDSTKAVYELVVHENTMSIVLTTLKLVLNK